MEILSPQAVCAVVFLPLTGVGHTSARSLPGGFDPLVNHWITVFFFHRTLLCVSSATKIQVTCTFRAMHSKEVGLHEDATELLSFHNSQTAHRNHSF